MHLIPFLILCAAALSAGFTWYQAAPPRRFASVPFALFLFIIGITLVFVLEGRPTLLFVTN